LRGRDHRPACPLLYESEDFVLDLVHYLVLLEQKTGASTSLRHGHLDMSKVWF